jgi:hypothetical protein
MNYWNFTSDNNWFRLKLPENWAEYDDEENTFAFFNTEKWSGNLRITHRRWENVEEGIDKASLYNQSELTDSPGAILVKLNKWDATFYIKEANEGDIIYFWITGSKNDLFICSFTFDKPFLHTHWHNDELIVVSEIPGSIKITG